MKQLLVVGTLLMKYVEDDIVYKRDSILLIVTFIEIIKYS